VNWQLPGKNIYLILFIFLTWRSIVD
jgi:hypothetical protein